MAHLPSGPGLGFAVQVQGNAGGCQRRRPFGFAPLPLVAEQVRHGRRAQHRGRPERQAADGADLLLELTGHAGVDGQVARVVRARRDLVDEQRAVTRQKELDAQDADGIEPFHDRARDLLGLPRDFRRDPRGEHGHVQDVVPVRVVDEAVVGERAVHAPRRDDAGFALERDESFQDALLTAQRLPRSGRFVGAQNLHLALAVVAEARRLEDGRAAQFAQRGLQFAP